MRALLTVLSALSLAAGCSSGGADNGTTGGGAGATGGGTTTGLGTTSSTVVTGTGDGGPLVLYGTPYTGGQYNLGPVDYAETQFHNARVPLSQVEVESPNHTSFAALMRGSDGTLTDGSGFGQGMFTIRSTGVDGHQVMDTFPWPAAGIAGAMLTGQGNFP